MDALISEFNRAIKRGVWKPYCALGVVVNTFAISYGNTLGNKVAAMRLNKLFIQLYLLLNLILLILLYFVWTVLAGSFKRTASLLKLHRLIQNN